MNLLSVQACARSVGISKIFLLNSALRHSNCRYRIKPIGVQGLILLMQIKNIYIYLKSPDSSETREEFALPTFTMCNYQAHSKHKIKDLYPFVRTSFPWSKTLTVRFIQQPEMPIRNLIKAQGWSISCILRPSQMMRSRIVPDLVVGDRFLSSTIQDGDIETRSIQQRS